MTSDIVAGVDWAGGKWLAVVFEGQSYKTCRLNKDLKTILEWEEWSFDRIVADVPIGLPDNEETLNQRDRLDSIARSTISSPSSVFPVPSRTAAKAAYAGEDYEAVAEKNELEVEKGLNTQSYSIAAGVGKVDEFLDEHENTKDIIVEAHPEVCFCGLLGSELNHSKKSAPGVSERLKALETIVENPAQLLANALNDLVEQSEQATVDDVTVDDVLDALVLGVTATQESRENFRYLSGTEEGSEDWHTDSKGFPMRMAYWADESLVDQL